MAKGKFISIKTELGLKFGATVIILLAMGFAALFTFKAKLVNMQQIDEKAKLATNSLELRANFDEMVVALKTMIIKADRPKIFNRELKIFKKKSRQVKKYEEKVLKSLRNNENLSKETIQYYSNVSNEIKSFNAALDKAIPVLKAGDGKGGAAILKGQGLGISANLAKFVKIVRAISDNERKELSATISKSISYGLIALAIISLFAIIAVLTFMKRICNMVKQINRLTKAADDISTGKSHPELKSDKADELGKLTESFERMRVSLEKAMNKLNKK